MFYPDLDAQTLKNLLVVRQLVSEHPNYFEDCPYSMEVEADLKKLVEPPPRAHSSSSVEREGDDFDLMREIKTTYTELNLHRPSNQEDAAMMSYYRTRAALLEKMLGQMEQAKNQKLVSDFFSIVTNILEEIATPAQQTLFVEKLKAYQ